MLSLNEANADDILNPPKQSSKGGRGMAKKSSKPEAAKPPARATQPNAITIRGSEEWKDWLERFASKLRSKPTAVIDLALAKLAAAEGFEEPPARMESKAK